MLNKPNRAGSVTSAQKEKLIAEGLVVSRGNDSSCQGIPSPSWERPHHSPLWGQQVQTISHNAPERRGEKKPNLNMQGCSFKMVRQELPECARRQSCSQDGEREGEGENGDGEQRSFSDVGEDKLVLPCFCSKAAKLKLFILYNYRCQFADCTAQKKRSLVARRGEIQPSLIGH